jgi:outer membrane biosynthesis protein TonB
MSEEKDKKKEEKPITDTTGQTAEKPAETPTTKAEIKVTHEFVTKPADVPPVEKPTEKPAEIPAEKPVETPAEKELRETKEKLLEREEQLGLIATKTFEDDKTAFLGQIKDPVQRADAEKRIGDDPEKLENAKMMASLIIGGIEQSGGVVKGKPDEKPAEKPVEKPEEIDDGTEKKPPKGANIPPAPATPAGGDAKAIAKEAIDACFAILADPSKSQVEKDAANQKVNEMYAEFRRGAKEGGKKDSYPLPPTMNCPKCGVVMQGLKCSCGYEIPKIQR